MVLKTKLVASIPEEHKKDYLGNIKKVNSYLQSGLDVIEKLQKLDKLRK